MNLESGLNLNKLISQINKAVKEIKAERDRLEQIKREQAKQEEDTRRYYIGEIYKFFSDLEPNYRYEIEINRWQTLLTIGDYLFIEGHKSREIPYIWCDTVKDSDLIVGDTTIDLRRLIYWNYDCVAQLYKDRELVLEEISRKIGL